MEPETQGQTAVVALEQAGGLTPTQLLASITALITQIEDDLATKFTLREAIALAVNLVTIVTAVVIHDQMLASLLIGIVPAVVTVAWLISSAIIKSKQSLMASNLLVARAQMYSALQVEVAHGSGPLQFGAGFAGGFGGVPLR